jgi:hypothetical protein
MTGLETEKGGNFKTGVPVPGLANLTGLLHHLRTVRLAFLAVGLDGRPGEAEQKSEESKQPHGFLVLILPPGSQRSVLLKNLHNFPLIFDL